MPTPTINAALKDNYSRGKVADFLREKICSGCDLSIVSAYFTIYAYNELKTELDEIGRLRFLFGEPRFINALDPTRTDKKAFRLTDDGLTVANKLQQKRVARECAKWIREKIDVRSIRQAGFLHGELTAVSGLQQDLKRVRHNLFSAKTPRTKNKYRERDKELREAIAAELEQSGWESDTARKLAGWDPYDQNASASYFDPEWMFDRGEFDIVIGNPPFGATISDSVRTTIGVVYNHQDYQLDTYLLSIRKFVFAETRVHTLVNVQSKVFAAVVDNTILIHSREYPSGNSFPVIIYDEKGFHQAFTQEQGHWSRNGEPISIALSPERQGIASQIERHLLLDHFCKVTPGCKPYQVGKGIPKQTRDIVSIKPFTSEEKTSTDFPPLLRGRLINRYMILWNKNLWIKFGEWLAEPRHTANYDAPTKIVMRQTGDSLIAALDSRRFVVMNNMFTIVPKSDATPIYFIISSLNSSTLNWYYRNCINPEKGEALAEIKKGHLIRLPIPEVEIKDEKVFRGLVGLVQLAKYIGDVSDSFFEDLIDACVMECYFRDHMAEHDLLFLDDLTPHLAAYDPGASEPKQHDFLTHLHNALNVSSHPIRNRLLRLTADSPDLLAVIKKEGRV